MDRWMAIGVVYSDVWDLGSDAGDHTDNVTRIFIDEDESEIRKNIIYLILYNLSLSHG